MEMAALDRDAYMNTRIGTIMYRIVPGGRGFLREPDLFRFSTRLRHAQAFEVENSVPLDYRRLQDYARVKATLERVGWRFQLFVVCRWGHVHEATLDMEIEDDG
jgi:hypothetical protein